MKIDKKTLQSCIKVLYNLNAHDINIETTIRVINNLIFLQTHIKILDIYICALKRYLKRHIRIEIEKGRKLYAANLTDVLGIQF